MVLRARTAAELERLLEALDRVRGDLALGTLSEDAAAVQLRRLGRRRRLTLAAAVERYAARPDLAELTRARARGFVRKAGPGAELADVELDALDGPRLQKWIDALSARCAPSTVGTAWRTLRAVVRYAAALGWIVRSPWGPWRPIVRAQKAKGAMGPRPRPPRECARTRDELARLLEHCPAQLRAVVAVGAGLGLRKDELRALRWGDVEDLAAALDEGGRCRVTVRGKGGALVSLPVPVDVARELGEWLIIWSTCWGERVSVGRVWRRGEPPTSADPVFPGPGSALRGRSRRPPAPYPPGSSPVRLRSLRAAVALAGLPHPEQWSAHSLRDSFCTIVAAESTDLAAVARLTRHSSIGNLLRYLRERDRERPPLLLVP